MNRRVHFNQEIEVQTLRDRIKQSKSEQQPGNLSTMSTEQHQLTAHGYKRFQELMDEVNTERRPDYKIFENSDRPNKLKVLYQQTVHFLEKELPIVS